MAQLVQNEESGQWALFDPASGLQPISDEQAAQMQKGTGGRILGAVGDSLQDSLGALLTGGRGMIFDDSEAGYQLPQETVGQDLMQSNDPRQDARRAVDPFAANTGAAVGMAAEMAFPMPKGGAAARAAPATISRGAQRGAATGQAVVDAARARAPAAVDDVADGSMGAARREGAQRSYGVNDSITRQQAENMAMPLTRNEGRYLDAMENGDIDVIRQAEQRLGNDDLMRNTSIPGTGGTAGDLGFKVKDKEQWFTEQVADELGRPDLARLGAGSINEVTADAKTIFKDAFDEGNYPAQVKFETPDGDIVDSLGQARQVLDTTSTPSPALNNAITRLENAAAKAGDGTYDSAALQEAFRKASSDAEAAFKAGNYDTGQSLASVAEIIGDALEAALPEAQKLDVAKARRRWKIKKVLERTSRTTSKTETGQINPATFQNNWREMTPGYKRNYRQRDDFEKTMDTVVALSADRANAGSTLMRGATRAAAPVLGASAITGLGAAGAGMLGQ